MPEVVGIQMIKGGAVFYCRPLDKRLAPGTICVVEAEHGLHAGRVVHAGMEISEKNVSNPLPKIIRVAGLRDHEQLKQNERKEREGYRLCRQKIKEKKLEMKLVDVAYTLDGRKAVFYFTADNRIDFRELVKELAQALKIKIEMRQIGVRDETRRLGGVGCCGRALCCCTFLRDFMSVSIRMAKDQNLSLNPTKVSGLCGRLMCCLAYEYEGPGNKDRKKKREGSGATTTAASETEGHACSGQPGGCGGNCGDKKPDQAATPTTNSNPHRPSGGHPYRSQGSKGGRSAYPSSRSNTATSGQVTAGSEGPTGSAQPASGQGDKPANTTSPQPGKPGENRFHHRRNRHQRFSGQRPAQGNNPASSGTQTPPKPSGPSA